MADTPTDDRFIRDAAGQVIGELRDNQEPLEQRVVIDPDTGRVLPEYHPKAEAILAAQAAANDVPPGDVEEKYSVVERPVE